MIQKFFNWLVLSSENPQQAGATIQGALLSVAIYFVAGANFLNFNVSQGDVEGLIELVTSLATVLLMAFGLIRKLYNTFKNFKRS